METIKDYNARMRGRTDNNEPSFLRRPTEQFAIISEDMTLMRLNYSLTDKLPNELIGKKIFELGMGGDAARFNDCVRTVLKTRRPMPFAGQINGRHGLVQCGWTIMAGRCQQIRTVYLIGGALEPVTTGAKRLTSA